MGIKVTKKPWFYYFNGKTPKCPECHSMSLWFNDVKRDLGLDEVDCSCLDCHCQFTAKRD